MQKKNNEFYISKNLQNLFDQHVYKQIYPSYQKEVLAIHYPGKIADLINIDGIANINILNQVRNEAKRFLFKH